MRLLPAFQTFPINIPNGTPASGSTFGCERNWHVSVLIPARNEEALLPRCLSSVQRARMKLPASVTSEVIVVDDGSSDSTRSIAERMLRNQGLVISIDGGVVGTARSVAAQAALDRYNGPADRHWLANTDADCCIPETWLLDQLSIAATNVQAIAGIVSVDSFGEHGPAVEERFRTSYVIHPDGSHPHVHGANFGVRADAYLRAGGWGSLCTAEDHDLWNRLLHTGSRRASPVRLRVVTSGRRAGRAPFGFAGALAAHNEDATGASV